MYHPPLWVSTTAPSLLLLGTTPPFTWVHGGEGGDCVGCVFDDDGIVFMLPGTRHNATG